MTPLQIQKVEALKLARARIKNGSSGLICYSLTQVAWQKPRLERACEDLKTYIGKVLGSRGSTLEGWQRQNNVKDSRDRVTGRRDRLAWIDWMIFCLENPDLPPPEPKGNTV